MDDTDRITSVSQFPQLGQIKCKLYMVVGTMTCRHDKDDVSEITWFLAVHNKYASMCQYGCIDCATVFSDKQLAQRLADTCSRQLLNTLVGNQRTDNYRWTSFDVENLCDIENRFLQRRTNERNRNLNVAIKTLDRTRDFIAPFNDDAVNVVLPEIRPSLLEFSFATAGDPSAVVNYITTDPFYGIDRDEFRETKLDPKEVEFIDRHSGAKAKSS